jgi:hypothetical protein
MVSLAMLMIAKSTQAWNGTLSPNTCILLLFSASAHGEVAGQRVIKKKQIMDSVLRMGSRQYANV